MRLIIFLSFFLLSGCSLNKFTKSGTGSICLVDYNNKHISCDFDTMEECNDEYAKFPGTICFTRKYLHLKGEN